MTSVPLPPPSQAVVNLERLWTDPWYRAIKRLAAASEENLRVRMTADTTFYIRTDGSDNNDGSANTAASAFATLTGAALYVYRNIDANGYTITFNIGDGTYTGATNVIGHMLANAGSVIITGTSSAILTNNDASTTLQLFGSGTNVAINGGISIRNSSTGHGLRVADNAFVTINNATFGATGASQIEVGIGGNLWIAGNYTINGAATNHIRVQNCGGVETSAITVTVSGTPAFSNAFVRATDGGVMQATSVTYSGSATGTRFIVDGGGSIQTFGGGLTYFPGDAAGALTGGWYDGSAYQNGFLISGDQLLTSGTSSSAATLDLVLTSYTGYRAIRILLTNLTPATNATTLYMRTSTDGGSNYDAGASDYRWARNIIADTAGASTASSAGDTEIEIAANFANASDTSGGVEVVLYNQTSTAKKGICQFHCVQNSNGGEARIDQGCGVRDATGDMNAVRFLFSSGNISTVSYAVYGLR